MVCVRFIRFCAPCADVATNAPDIYARRFSISRVRACMRACGCMCPYAAIKPRGVKVLLVSRPTKLREDNSDRRDALGMFFPHSGKDIHVCTHIHAYVYVLGLTVFEKSP